MKLLVIETLIIGTKIILFHSKYINKSNFTSFIPLIVNYFTDNYVQPEKTAAVSSTYENIHPLFNSTFVRELIHVMKRMGPSTLPCAIKFLS